ncbi:hypothetical protein LMG29542_08115 [Paraburkholderia humisilvae]|uniref:Uncharacterized protein n=1 Tax=Paraburkholderia humisilvae TaxID=627669 RepID=A0A6J5FBA9_9BURK|nr:hypothetical protein LMG29542_08115 [Paraburkholderia humisilvae]
MRTLSEFGEQVTYVVVDRSAFLDETRPRPLKAGCRLLVFVFQQNVCSGESLPHR